MHGVGGGHGQANRLLIEDIEVDQFDRLVASGGVGLDVREAALVESVRVGNKLLGPSRFGKMFPDLEPFRPPDEALIDLGRAMFESQPEDPALNNSDIPAGFTYLGQFIDHDITRDNTEGFPPFEDPELIEQGRRVTLELDSLYGQGPRRHPDLYAPGFPRSRAVFRLGDTTPVTGAGPALDVPFSLPNDLPRRPNKEAVLVEDRNDENTVVAQTHVAFLKFHNRVIDRFVRGEDEVEGDRGGTRFDRAKRRVTWYYQWIVLNDFLPNLIDPNVLDDIRTNGRRFYDFERDPFDGEPFMPLEFSAAAYRLGHSMVREQYNFNRVFSDPLQVPGAVVPATLDFLFTFTGKGGMRGNPTLPTNWVIDWRRFFPVDDPAFLNFTRRIDTKVAPRLHQLPNINPGQPTSLPARNLLRGSRVGLPTAQDIAEAMNVQALTPDQIASGDDDDVLREHGFHERTPLWYYILKEAELQGASRRLGEIGSRIVGEVFFGLLEGDPNSFLSRRPGWRPTLPSVTQGNFTMADLLRFVNEIDPIG